MKQDWLWMISVGGTDVENNTTTKRINTKLGPCNYEAGFGSYTCT